MHYQINRYSSLVTTPNDDDIDPTNNRVDYAFQAPAVAIPIASWRGLIALGIGLLVVAGSRRVGRTASTQHRTLILAPPSDPPRLRDDHVAEAGPAALSGASVAGSSPNVLGSLR
jgi:hypothetical protein